MDAIRGNLHHPLVVLVPDEDIARSINRYTDRVAQSAAHRSLDATGGDLYCVWEVEVHDEDIARTIDRHADRGAQTAGSHRGLYATGRDLYYLSCFVIRNEEIARSIKCQSYVVMQPARWHRSLRARTKRNRGSLSDAVDRHGRQKVGAVVEKLNRTHSQSWRERGEDDVHGAGITRGDGSGTGAAGAERKVETGCALGDYLDRADGDVRRGVVR